MPDRPNLLRLLIGYASTQKDTNDDSVIVLESNLDDVTGEQIGFAIEKLWRAGALDVFAIPIQMKKNRPGTLLTVIAKLQDRQTMQGILFQHTGTLGIRYRKQVRTILQRAAIHITTEWGTVRGKVSELPSGEVNFSPEYDDCSKIAANFDLRLSDVFRVVEDRYRQGVVPTVIPTAENSNSQNLTEALEKEPERNLDVVNAVFRQAAVEDELESLAYEKIPMDSDIKSDLPKANPLPPTWITNVESATETQGFYRWDSSPWDATLVQKLAPKQSIASTDVTTASPALSEPKQWDQRSITEPKQPWLE